MANDETRKRGAVTDYRPDDDTLRGDNHHSVQSEALGEEGDANLSQSGTTMSGGSGQIEDLDKDPATRRPS